MANREYITFGVQAGDSAANAVVQPHYMRLREVLREHCRGDYSEAIKEFAFVLRIDGKISQWQKIGCDYLRVSPKRGCATVDIFMPMDVWEDHRSSQIPSFLRHYIEEGFMQIMERVASKKIAIKTEELYSDFGRAMAAFWNDAPLDNKP